MLLPAGYQRTIEGWQEGRWATLCQLGGTNLRRDELGIRPGSCARPATRADAHREAERPISGGPPDFRKPGRGPR